MASAQLYHRADSPAAGSAYLFHRAKSPTIGYSRLSHRASNTATSVRLWHRASSPSRETAYLQHRAASDGAVFPPSTPGNPTPPPPNYPNVCLPIDVGGLSAWEAAWKLGVSGLKMTIKGGENANRDISEIPYKFEVSHQRSGAMGWQLYIQDDLGIYHPFKAGGPWAGVLGFSSRHRIDVSAEYGGRTFKYTGPATGLAHQRRASDGGWFKDLVWRGTDESKWMFTRSVTMPTARSTRTRIQKALPLVKEMLSAAGLAGPKNFKDFPIRLLHRQNGRYGDWIQRLLEVNGQQWRVDGKTLVCYDSLLGDGAQYTYSADSLVADDSYDSDVGDMLTRVVVRRLAEKDDDAAGTEPEVATKFGKYTKQFEKPLTAPQWHATVENMGIFSDFIFRDKGGNVIGVRKVRGGVWPSFLLSGQIQRAVSVEYTFGARAGVLATEGYGEIYFTGITDEEKSGEEEFPDAYNESFTLPVIDDDLERDYDMVREELEVNELIATKKEAESYGRGYINKAKAALFPLTLTVPLNPDIVDGARVRLIDTTLGATLDRVVISSTHTFHDNPAERKTTFTCGGYLL